MFVGYTLGGTYSDRKKILKENNVLETFLLKKKVNICSILLTDTTDIDDLKYMYRQVPNNSLVYDHVHEDIKLFFEWDLFILDLQICS